jgi:hypothetical protein
MLVSKQILVNRVNFMVITDVEHGNPIAVLYTRM